MKYERNNKANYVTIDTPDGLLFTCFYCGEPASTKDHMPPLSRFHDYYAIYDQHRPLQVPCCNECNILLGATLQPNIYKRVEELKIKLTTRYKKIIRYMDIWDEDSLEFSEFTGNFLSFVEGLKLSCDVVERRLNWVPWEISVDGHVVEVKASHLTAIRIGKLNFATIDHLFHHARKVDKIPQKYLESVIQIVGFSRIEYAYNFCKINKIKSEAEMRLKLKDLVESLAELR